MADPWADVLPPQSTSREPLPRPSSEAVYVLPPTLPPIYSPNNTFPQPSVPSLPVRPASLQPSAGQWPAVPLLDVPGVGFVLPMAAGNPPHTRRLLHYQLINFAFNHQEPDCYTCTCLPSPTSATRSPTPAHPHNRVLMNHYLATGAGLLSWYASDVSLSLRIAVEASTLTLSFSNSWQQPQWLTLTSADMAALQAGQALTPAVAITANAGCCCYLFTLPPICIPSFGCSAAFREGFINVGMRLTAPLCPLDDRMQEAVQHAIDALARKTQDEEEKQRQKKANVDRENEATLSTIAFRASRQLLATPPVAPSFTQPALQAVLLQTLCTHPIVLLLFPPYTASGVFTAPKSPSASAVDARYLLLREELETALVAKLGPFLDLSFAAFAVELRHLCDVFIVRQEQVALQDKTAASQLAEMQRAIAELKQTQAEAAAAAGSGSGGSFASDGLRLASTGISLFRLLV